MQIDLLEKAFERRKALFNENPETDCFRLFCGAREGIPGLTVDRYAGALFIQDFEGRFRESEEDLAKIAQWYREKIGDVSVYRKRFIKDRSSSQRVDQALLLGKDLGEPLIARENGLLFKIKPLEGFSVGLFLDQRNNRRELSERSKGLRVLNLFSYTCAFSVYCAENAARVTSVDLSKKALEWGKENFAINQLSIESHKFVAADALEFLRICAKKKERYDLVIADPPSFSRNREGKVFSVAKDFRTLFEKMAEVVAPGGSLFFSTNLEAWNTELVLGQAATYFPDFKNEEIPVPVDFIFQEHRLSQIFLRS